MKTVKLVLNKKEYSKTAPTVEDWLLNLEITEKIDGKNILSDLPAAQATIDVVARYLKIPSEEIIKYGELQAVMEAYHSIQSNLISAFVKAQEVWGKNVEKPAK